MFGLSFWEIGLILLVALLVLGPKKLPGFLKTVGKGLRELRRASSDLRSAIEEPLDEVRKPLQDMKDDLVDAVYSMEEEIESEAGEDDDPKLLDSGEGDDADKVKVKEVEAMYAAAEKEARAADELAKTDPLTTSPNVRKADDDEVKISLAKGDDDDNEVKVTLAKEEEGGAEEVEVVGKDEAEAQVETEADVADGEEDDEDEDDQDDNVGDLYEHERSIEP